TAAGHAEPAEAFLDAAHDRVVGEIELGVEGGSIHEQRPVAVVGQTQPIVAAAGPQPAPDLRRQDKLVAAHASQRGRDAPFSQTEPVQRCRVDQAVSTSRMPNSKARTSTAVATSSDTA